MIFKRGLYDSMAKGSFRNLLVASLPIVFFFFYYVFFVFYFHLCHLFATKNKVEVD